MMVRMKKRITISIDPEVLATVQEDVEAGKAANVSAAIEAILKEDKRLKAFDELLEMLEAAHPDDPITEEEIRQAEEELSGPGSTRGDASA
jgi:Arc/MetJ-type ribon-helix-helix transcriptional regulator